MMWIVLKTPRRKSQTRQSRYGDGAQRGTPSIKRFKNRGHSGVIMFCFAAKSSLYVSVML
jgi:hypothetical protein